MRAHAANFAREKSGALQSFPTVTEQLLFYTTTAKRNHIVEAVFILEGGLI